MLSKISLVISLLCIVACIACVMFISSGLQDIILKTLGVVLVLSNVSNQRFSSKFGQDKEIGNSERKLEPSATYPQTGIVDILSLISVILSIAVGYAIFLMSDLDVNRRSILLISAFAFLVTTTSGWILFWREEKKNKLK